MKFKYDIKNNYYKMYGEANYLVLNKKKYLSGKNISIKNYFNIFIVNPIVFLLLMIICIFLNIKFLILIFFFLSFIFLIILFMMLNSYKIYKNGNHKGVIIINEDGITDESDLKVTFPWEKVELVGITNNMMAIVLDSPFVLILEPNEKIIKEIKKYKDVKVIK